VELLHLAGTYPIQEMKEYLVKKKYNNKEADITQLRMSRKLTYCAESEVSPL
jgi:hypothetical protein